MFLAVQPAKKLLHMDSRNPHGFSHMLPDGYSEFWRERRPFNRLVDWNQATWGGSGGSGGSGGGGGKIPDGDNAGLFCARSSSCAGINLEAR